MITSVIHNRCLIHHDIVLLPFVNSRHKTQQSMGSSTDFSSSMWLTEDAWCSEVADIDKEIEGLEQSFVSGKMNAFGK